MESQFTQLRFDILEEVRLHPQQPGIDALLELDLYPDVEIKDEGQHLKIQGYLRLNGIYVGEGKTDRNEEDPLHTRLREEETNELAYVIPVEITLPADRAERSRISAEVETFDYEVLSPFELKIEAILMIDGLLPEWKEEEEQAEEMEPKYPVFSGATAQPVTISQEHSQDQASNTEENHAAYLQPFEENLEKKDAGNGMEQVQDAELSPETGEKTENAHAGEQEAALPKEESEPEQEKEAHQGVNVEIKPSPQDFWRDRQQSKVRQDESTETPIAKLEKTEKGERTEEPDMCSKEEVKEQQDLHMEEQSEPYEETQINEETETGMETGCGEETERVGRADWIRWLVKGKEENFVPMRMVIVQENETIDHVANKYEVSADWLVKINRLQTDRLEPGQILQVPEKKNRDDEDREAYFQ